jgi:hypothetical protein
MIAGHRYALTPGRYVGVEVESLEKSHECHGLCVRVSLQMSRAGFMGVALRPPSFVTVIPAGQDVATWCAARYGRLGWPPEITAAPDRPVWSRIDPALEECENKIRQTLNDVGWPVSRLINFVKNAEYLRSQKSPERAVKIVKCGDEERLILPVEPHFDAAYGAVREIVIANRCLLVALLPGVDGSFLAGWLNSDDGRKIRTAAMTEPGRSPRTLSSGNLLRFLDGLIVPVPDLDIQVSIADTSAMLGRARQLVAQLTAELWQAPSGAADIQSATRLWLDSVPPRRGPEQERV